MLDAIFKKLRARRRSRSPFTPRPKGRGLHFVKPDLICEVSFAQWTKEGLLRAPVFHGLRFDKAPRQIRIERPAEEEQIKITHPDRIIYAQERITKGEIVEYYRQVAELLLPHIQQRPLSLVRCPGSSTSKCFYSKHFAQNLPPHLERIPEKGKEPFFSINDSAGLLTLIQYGTLEIHPWGCHSIDLEKPDQIIMDLDPDPSVAFGSVVEAALELRQVFKHLGLKSFVKLTGGKGLHVQCPIATQASWDELKAFTKEIALEMASRNPDAYTANVTKRSRRGKIFVDYLRNGRGATAVAPWSLRAKARSSVAMPVSWKLLQEGQLSPDQFDLKSALAHIQKTKNPWLGYHGLSQSTRFLR